MENEKLTVLIVEDQKMNRVILRTIVETEYNVLEAENGEDALRVLNQNRGVSAILLDIIMPVMDGYSFLEALRNSPYPNLPVIVITGEQDEETEQKALNLGAWDFVSKPFLPSILLIRLKNAIVRSQFYLISKMKYAYEHDPLTDLYNRTKFFSDTRKLLDEYPDRKFALVCFDIDRFHIFNAYWGEEEGNRLLRFIADGLRRVARTSAPCVYARINADAFAMCEPYDEAAIADHVRTACAELAAYNDNYLVEPSFGVYVIGDPAEKIQLMLEHATLAGKECKNKYMTYISYYRPEMNDKVLHEQQIVNEMQRALDNEEFEVYLQPKFNLKTERPYGAEALVRWRHPTRGLIPPGEFIPVFERNGFIGKVDYYMWDKCCALLRRWIDAGINPAPISVNMSRVNLYNPNLTQMLTDLVRKYGVPARLLNLELTESAYMENPAVMEKMVLSLQRAGFIILMDDFGSGYSSLNTLKNIPVDILKIDMKFLSGERNLGAEPDMGRNECILASVIRMAGWLELPVIMEGVETLQQVEFLKSIGCGYVQGYYYARPMPIADYEALVSGVKQIPAEPYSENHKVIAKTIWASDPEIDLLFNSIAAPSAIYEYDESGFHALRVNPSFISYFGYGEAVNVDLEKMYCAHLTPQAMETLMRAFREASEAKGTSACEYGYLLDGGGEKKIRADLKYWGASERTQVLFATFSDAR